MAGGVRRLVGDANSSPAPANSVIARFEQQCRANATRNLISDLKLGWLSPESVNRLYADYRAGRMGIEVVPAFLDFIRRTDGHIHAWYRGAVQ